MEPLAGRGQIFQLCYVRSWVQGAPDPARGSLAHIPTRLRRARPSPWGASARSPWRCRPGPSPASSSMPVFEGGCALLLLRVARISLRQALPLLPPVCPVGSRAPPSSPVCPHFSPLLPPLTSSTSCPRISISFSSLWHTWSQASRRQPGLVRHKV